MTSTTMTLGVTHTLPHGGSRVGPAPCLVRGIAGRVATRPTHVDTQFKALMKVWARNGNLPKHPSRTPHDEA